MESAPERHSPHGSDDEERSGQSPVPGSSQRQAARTPGVPANPFEWQFLSRLHLPTFSPNVFAPPAVTPESQKKVPKQFRWDIETLAEGRPADIEEPIDPRQCTESYDVSQEEHIQRTISAFFSTDLVAPSPLHQPAPAYNLLSDNCQAGTSQDCEQSVRNVGCQTNLTLPPTLDMSSLLSGYLMSDAQVEEVMSQRHSSGGDSPLSSSSLRRKLFHNHSNAASDDDDHSSATMESRSMSDAAAAAAAAVSISGAKIQESPVLLPQMPRQSFSQQLPVTPLVACSPMVTSSEHRHVPATGSCVARPGARTRTCSFNAEDMASPGMSPIDLSCTPGHGSRSHVRAALNDRVDATPTTSMAVGLARDRCFRSPMSARPSGRRQMLGGGAGVGARASNAVPTEIASSAGDGALHEPSAFGVANDCKQRNAALAVADERQQVNVDVVAPPPAGSDVIGFSDWRLTAAFGRGRDGIGSSSVSSSMLVSGLEAPSFQYFAPASAVQNWAARSDSQAALAAHASTAPDASGDNPNITWHPSSYSTPQKADCRYPAAAERGINPPD